MSTGGKEWPEPKISFRRKLSLRLETENQDPSPISNPCVEPPLTASGACYLTSPSPSPPLPSPVDESHHSALSWRPENEQGHRLLPQAYRTRSMGSLHSQEASRKVPQDCGKGLALMTGPRAGRKGDSPRQYGFAPPRLALSRSLEERSKEPSTPRRRGGASLEYASPAPVKSSASAMSLTDTDSRGSPPAGLHARARTVSFHERARVIVYDEDSEIATPRSKWGVITATVDKWGYPTKARPEIHNTRQFSRLEEGLYGAEHPAQLESPWQVNVDSSSSPRDIMLAYSAEAPLPQRAKFPVPLGLRRSRSHCLTSSASMSLLPIEEALFEIPSDTSCSADVIRLTGRQDDDVSRPTSSRNDASMSMGKKTVSPRYKAWCPPVPRSRTSGDIPMTKEMSRRTSLDACGSEPKPSRCEVASLPLLQIPAEQQPGRQRSRRIWQIIDALKSPMCVTPKSVLQTEAAFMENEGNAGVNMRRRGTRNKGRRSSRQGSARNRGQKV